MGPAVFKTVEGAMSSLAGSIPVRLRPRPSLSGAVACLCLSLLILFGCEAMPNHRAKTRCGISLAGTRPPWSLMIAASELGNAINEQRLSLHYSIGQLATVVGVTASEVRSWENGEVVPDGPTLGKLAEALGVKQAKLEKLAPQQTPAKPADLPEATSVVAATAKQSPTKQTQQKTSKVEESSAGEAETAKDGPETPVERDVAQPVAPRSQVKPPQPVAASQVAVEPEPTAVVAAAAAEAEKAALVELPTERIPVIKDAPPPPERQPTQPPVAVVTAPPPQPRADAVTQSAPAIVTPWRQTLEAIFDRDKPWLFWIRTFGLLIGLLILLRILAWAVPEFFTALGDILDTIQSTTPDPELEDPIPVAP